MPANDHWVVFDETLRHPDGRAKGGEPCVQCGEPIAAKAPWKQRDRHVCSSRCNMNLVRRFNRRKTAGIAERRETAEAKFAPIPNPRLTVGPRVFATTPTAPIPFEWEGYAPLPGDVVERYGIRTTYNLENQEVGDELRRVLVATAPNGEQLLVGADEDGFPTRLLVGQWTSAGKYLGGKLTPFVVGDVLCEWRGELVTDLHQDGSRTFTWEAYSACPVNAPAYPPSLQSPRYRAEFDRRARVQSNTSRNVRRVIGDAVVEQFDPHEVFDRDGWFCQLCGEEVDAFLLYPNGRSASLDHVRPVSHGGDHTQENTQLAHLECNLRKQATWWPQF